MTRYLLANIFVLATFIAVFWQLARRADLNARTWLFGWAFILIHDATLLLGGGPSIPSKFASLAGLWSLELCGLCFIRAAGSIPETQVGRIFLAEMAVPVLLQAILFTFHVTFFPLHLLAGLLLFVPLVHMLAAGRDRTRPLFFLSISFATLGLIGILFGAHQPVLVVYSGLCILFTTAAYLYGATPSSIASGTAITGIGLAVWGFSYLIAVFLAALPPPFSPIGVDPILMDLPQYAVAYGMISTLLEQVLGRTELLARLDPLTGLPNSRYFEDRFASALVDSAANGNPIACLVIDVDKFKQVNDTLGHPVGDELLKALATRLSWHIGPRDTLARTGGDEFSALLVGQNDVHHLHFIARAMMSASSVPVSVLGHSIDVAMSIGIAVSADGAPNIAALRKSADDAMYIAKRKGGGHLVIAGEDDFPA